MAACARAVWKNWFRQDVHIARILDWIAVLAQGPRPDERVARARWPAQEFVVERLLAKMTR